MLYKTMILELLQDRTELHEQLRLTRTLLPTLEAFAQELKTGHEAWKEALTHLRPGHDLSQISSVALEMALKDLEDRLPFEFPPDGTEPLSLDAAMAFINNIHTLPD